MKTFFCTVLTTSLVSASCFAVSLDDVISHFDRVMPDSDKYYTDEISVHFTDVPDNHWAKESIYHLAKNGVVSGTSTNTYSPANTTTLSQYIKLAVCSAAIVDEDATLSYTDITPDDWEYIYVASAKAAGALDIYSGDTLNGESEITREDMAYIAYKLLIFRGLDISVQSSEKFSDDSDISDYAKEAVYALRQSGIISGSGNNMFEPKNTTTRAEAAQIIYNMLKFIEK